MTKEKAKVKHKEKNSLIFTVSSIIVVIIIVCVMWKMSYSMLTNRIIKTSIQSMEELANHDKRAIENSLENKWDMLTGIAKNIRQEKWETNEELLEELNSGKQLMECIRLTFVADNANTVSSNMTISNDEDLLEICRQSDNKFIYSHENLRATTEGRGQELILGVEITPFVVEGNTYTYLVAQMDIDTFQDELKIDCYNGRGYSSVIDYDGKYIVKIDRNYTAQVIENFYTEIRDGKLEDGYTVEKIQQQIENGENFSISCVQEDGTTYIMAFTPMEEAEWYFVMSVPKEVFQEQSMDILKIVLFLMVAILIAVFVITIILIRRRYYMYAMEQKHQKELADALVLAEQANRAKTIFLNNMSHDIRTPMNAIIGFTALASTHIDNKERVKDYLAKITQSSNHLLSLINDVLDMSRIESGKMNIEEKPENLAEILHNIRNIVQADIHANQQEFFIDTVDVTDEEIYCDKLRLNQILLNLLSNAIKFTQPGGTISVRIMQTAVSKSGYGTYEFRVKDTGIGMSKEFADTIFEPFTRERNSTVSGIQGTGLGMSITKNIVDMMGGTIEVITEEGIGTEFIVKLEFKLQTEHKEIEVIKSLEGLRSLVVDDDINACQSVSQMLRQIGMRAEWTMYGREAIVRTQEAVKIGDKYQVYIIDWLMPDMNGIETTRRIRKVVGEDAPIIILTAYDWTDIEEEAKEAGVTGFISKPLFPSELQRILMQVCGEVVLEEEGEEVSEVEFRGKRLLIVEDNELNREIATEILLGAGFVIEIAENGQEAVELVSKSAPGYYDAILMDVQMPVMDGYEATRRIRKLENPMLSRIPIIAMTANAFEEDKQAAYAAGMDAHVGKPIDISVLFDTLKQALK